MALLLFLILLHLNVKLTSAYFLNKEETSISIELIKKLQIRQCILVENKKNEDLISDAKEFSSTNIPTAYLNYSLLIDYVDNNEAVYFFTGLIFKEENLNVLIGISEYFKKVSELGLGDSTLLSMLSFKTNKIYKLRNYVWLIFLKNYKNLNKLVVPYDCEFMVVHPENSTTYTVAEIYTVKNTFFSLNFGKWTRDLGFKTACGSFYRRRLDFQKSELTVDGYPIQGEEDPGNVISVIIGELFEGFAYRLNLTVRRDLKKTLENIDENHLDGDILEDAIWYDLNVSTLDQLGPIYQASAKMYIRHPAVEIMSDYYLQPFSTHLWLVLLSAVILETILIIITQSLIPCRKRTLIDNLFLGLELFCGQSGNEHIENSSLRLICISFIFTAFFLTGLYGAIITSFFAVELFQPPFTNLEEFIASGEYQLLKDEEDFIVEKLLPQMPGLQNLTTLFPFNDNNYELFEKLCQGKYAAFSLSDYIYTLDLSCRVYEIPKYFLTLSFGLALNRNSSFTRILRKNLIRFYEIGFYSKFYRLNDELRPKKILEDTFHPIKIDQMTQVLSIPLIGILLGMTIMIIEVSRTKFLKEKNRKISH